MLNRDPLRRFVLMLVMIPVLGIFAAAVQPAFAGALSPAADSAAAGGAGVAAELATATAAEGATDTITATTIATAAGITAGRDSSVAPDTTKGTATDARHRVRVTKNYYVSLCSYGLGELGFGGKKFNPDYAEFAKKLGVMVGDLGFRAPVVKGTFLQLAYQIPGYFDPKSPEEMVDLFAAMKRFIRSGSLDEFRTKWPVEARQLDNWFPGSAKSYFQRTLGGREDVVSQALDTWAQYMGILWPKYQAEYATKLKDYPFEVYESRCNKLAVFEAWQREFGVEYPYADLVLIVCPENPTMASSIGPDKVVFGAMHSWDQMKNSVVHEIGARYPSLFLLFQHPSTSAIMGADYEGMLKLIQMEVCFRTPRILPDLTRDSFVTGMRLEKLMAWRTKQELSGGLKDTASTGPAELLSQLYARAKRDGAL